MTGRASVVGLGVIGASVAAGLRRANWYVTGSDLDATRANQALKQGHINAVSHFVDPDADVVFVAVPPLQVIDVTLRALEENELAAVTDVASVKVPMSRDVKDPRFVPGHPMAGSELPGLEGVNPSLFSGATWVLVQSDHTDEGALSLVTGAVADLKALVRIMDAEQHDRIVASISHAPQLIAVSLVNSALADAGDDGTLIARVAGAGFRDMTRIASSDPTIWIDICRMNAPAIREALNDVSERLQSIVDMLESDDELVLESALRSQFASARDARGTIPTRPEKQNEIVVQLNGRGVADVFKVATKLDIDIVDHYTHTSTNSMHLSVVASSTRALWGGLQAIGMPATIAD